MVAITKRELVTLKKLAEAHAKMRFSEEVTEEDAQSAIKLLSISLKQSGHDPKTDTISRDNIQRHQSKKNKLKILLKRIKSREGEYGTADKDEIL